MASLLAPVNWMLEALMLTDPAEAEGDNPAGEGRRPTWDLLCKQNAECSAVFIDVLSSDEHFVKAAAHARDAIVQRDAEDDAKLHAGVELSIERGVLAAMQPPSVSRIDVQGKTPAAVCQQIVAQLPKGAEGYVIVLQGRSGTGKGTTAAALLEQLPRAATWSNGNVFRALTLLAATQAKNENVDLMANAAEFLTTANVATWMSMLSFERDAAQGHQIRVHGLGHNALVCDIQNTVLKEPFVAKAIPTVAQQTQGDVIKFAVKALKTMTDSGLVVVLEGREATVQYIPTPHRFELILSDPDLVGRRRAAQRVMAECHAHFAAQNAEPTRQAILSHAKSLCRALAHE
eukprot:TRINITY_DN21004_c0_g1_i1.p1 TRINITY_DN21004_c0_g1~~TRINITY_DN21004_c0_g1_i1.p1  ORF type:complete len:367 (+),score=139.35 TRINITY_DN21004_c0_g1_i1:64-1101(+)